MLALLPLPNHLLQARCCGSYVVAKRFGDVSYVIHTPDCCKTRHLCHINMLKSYYETDNVGSEATIASVYGKEDSTVNEDPIPADSVTIHGSCTLQNSDNLASLATKLSHLSQLQHHQVSSLPLELVDLFSNTPGKTSCVYHDVDVMGAIPITQHT